MTGMWTPMRPARAPVQALLALLLMLVATGAHAQRAWLDRDQIRQGETVTLNIQSDTAGAPDYTALSREFDVSGHSSRTQMQNANGRMSVQTLYAVALRPRRAGQLIVPALPVGNGRTEPLTLMVEAGAGATAISGSNDDVFIRGEPDDVDPYVQQSVGWVVRLYSAAPLISGQLTQEAPEGASLQQVGEDARYSRMVDGRRFEVVERRFLLIPERSGTLVVPGASFEGRGTGGLFDDLFGGRGASLNAQAPPVHLRVQAAPGNTPQPWLPLHDLRLRYAGAPQDLRAGASGAITVEVIADGANAAQMPELQLPAIDGAQVFAEPVQADETFRNGRPGVKLTRRFSIVPARAGELVLPGMSMSWWDVAAGASRQARLPPMRWTVASGSGTPGTVGGITSVPGPITAPGVAGEAGDTPAGVHRGWILATAVFAALWLFTLVWGLHRRGAHAAGTPAFVPVPPGPDGVPATGNAHLARVLDTGDLGDVAQALVAMARPPARDVDELLDRLADPTQREAVDALQRARWGGGDGVAARGLLRSAFARGPRWKATPAHAPSPLPPLYPKG